MNKECWMYYKEKTSTAVLVAAAIFIGAVQSSYALTHRTDDPNVNAASVHCVGCATTSYIVTLSGGPLWTDAGKSQTFYLQPDVQKTYEANRLVHSQATGELFLGAQTLLEEGFKGQLGLSAAIAGTTLKGDIWDDATPEFNNYTYQYTAHNMRYAFKTKLLVDVSHDFSGYASGSAGVSVNRSGGFSITPTVPGAVAAPNFSPNTEMSFSYTLGAGIERALCEHWNVGVGYEFADWGRNSLARAPEQSLNNGLGMSHLYTNELLFSITYVV